MREQKHPDEAAAEYREGFRLAPGFAVSHIEFGTLLEDQKHADEAEAEYREAIRLDPKNPLAYICTLARCYQSASQTKPKRSIAN